MRIPGVTGNQRRHAGFAIALTMAMPVAASAQVSAQAPYPNRPIRLIVPYPPGAGTDFTGREVGAQFSKALGQQVVVDNRGGAAATIGHALAAKSAPDGYTLLLGTTGGLVSGPALMGTKIRYDPLKDFATIGLATYVPYAIVVTASLPANNIKELIDLARASPRKLNVASPGVGTPNHLGAAQLMTLTGIELVHVPYKGGALAVTDLIAGNVQVLVTGLLQLLPHHRTGRLRILGVGHPQRLKAYPDIPAIAETVPGYYNTGWWGIVAPAGTPRAIVDRLNGIMNKALATPEVLQRFEKNGLEVATTTPQGFHDMIVTDLQMWKKLIKDAKISVDVLP
ncbi:MAG: tripartite tricarboxylate transporter substrate binding protein [Betaproteobacteria bacterium]|nr:tripartite tricarboxylate transporter substrate binding protein [Betaproteobacteria bacterium]MBI3053697.1 tripartite tricarboxylate transporter substrate binding protein [Betaproteobacteria bacterium]